MMKPYTAVEVKNLHDTELKALAKEARANAFRQLDNPGSGVNDRQALLNWPILNSEIQTRKAKRAKAELDKKVAEAIERHNAEKERIKSLRRANPLKF